MWWDEAKITSTVTRQFILSQLRADEAEKLDQALEFGDGLTDHTYMEWIQGRVKRIFLILVDLGVPDQIFPLIDDSWDDDDLPVPLNQVDRLMLTYDKDERIEKKFYQRQFTYLLRDIHHGDNMVYDDSEYVPIEVLDKRAVVGLATPNIDKVYLAKKPDRIFLRRRIALGTSSGQMSLEQFMAGLQEMRGIEHKHMVSVWASYIHRSYGYVLFTPVNDSTLKGFLNMTPQSIKILPKQERRVMFLSWIHCLADALAFLHSRGLAHKKIKPSNVMFDTENNIFLSDCSAFGGGKRSSDGKKAFDKESYDYAAPEYWIDRVPTVPKVQVYRGSSSRIPARPLTAHSSVFSENSHSSSSGGSSHDSEPLHTSTTPQHPSRLDPQKADIFSLGCIILDILSAFLKRPNRTFTSHRSAKNKTPGRGGGLPDSSFQKNLGQVESWILMLLKDGSKKEDRLYRGVSHILDLLTRMLHPEPAQRPDAAHVRDRLREVLVKVCGISDACCAFGTTRPGAFGRKENSSNPATGAGMRVIEGKDVSTMRSQGETSSGHRRMDSASTRASEVTITRANSTATARPALKANGSSDGGAKTPTDAAGHGIGVAIGGANGNGNPARMQSGGYTGPVGGAGGAAAKAWQAPVYAGTSASISLSM